MSDSVSYFVYSGRCRSLQVRIEASEYAVQIQVLSDLLHKRARSRLVLLFVCFEHEHQCVIGGYLANVVACFQILKRE